MISRVEIELLALSKFRKAQIDLLTNGVRIERERGATIESLRQSVCGDRFRLALRFLQNAETIRTLDPPLFRDSISRSYYAMYHAARAVVYFTHGGDDYQDHDQLHKYLPPDFPDAETWSNELKEARLRRNEADYDPYPKRIDSFRRTSERLHRIALSFCSECRRYLVLKGCL